MKTAIRLFILAAALLAATTNSFAQGNFSQAQSQAEAKLKAALAELNTLRKEIAEKKIPLSKELSRIEDDVISARRELENLERKKDLGDVNLADLEKHVESLRNAKDEVDSYLREFISGFGGGLHISENTVYEDPVVNAEQAPQNPNLTLQQKLEAQVDVVDLALTRMENLLGGHTYEGNAAYNRESYDGKFLYYGPMVYFASNDKSVAGIAQTENNSDDPVLFSLGKIFDTATVAETILSGEGPLPIDATLGKVIKVERGSKSLDQYIEDGGEVGYAIIGLGIISLLLGVFKAFEVMSFKAPAARQVNGVLQKLETRDMDGAKSAADKVGGISGEMLSDGVAHANEKREIVEELMFEKILRIRPKLERFLPFLAITAATAPLMGLLGTVIGMIKTFNLITLFGTGDAKSLSSGISEALVTTALGLIVAIPVLILHGILSRMAKQKVGNMEQAAVAFINGISVLDEKPASTPEPEPEPEKSDEESES